MAEGQHGATHAWTEIYIPGAGWRGLDPTNNKLVGSEHIPVGVSREQEKASPLSGSWEGPSDALANDGFGSGRGGDVTPADFSSGAADLNRSKLAS